MAAKFKLIPNPTFNATVTIPAPGCEGLDLGFTFKHRSVKEAQGVLKEYQDKVQIAIDRGDVSEDEASKMQADYIMEIAQSWDIDEVFSVENVIKMIEGYPQAFATIGSVYQYELYGYRQKP